MAESEKSLISLLTWTFDKVLELLDLDHTTRKDRFEKVFEPLFNDMQVIHTKYIDLFKRVINMLPREDNGEVKLPKIDMNGERYFYETDRVAKGSKEHLERYALIKNYISTLNQRDLSLRISARTLSARIISKGHNVEEKQFCFCILNYFLDHGTFATFREQEEFMKKIEQEGFHSNLNTPSALVNEVILAKDNTVIITNINSIKLTLYEKFTEIVKSYQLLKSKTFA